MLKVALFASSAILALAADARANNHSSFHPRAGLTLLWNQNSPDADSINSQNYTSGGFTDLNSAGADDFVIPAGKTWTIEEVDVSGVDSYFSVSSMNITFYQNHEGMNGGIDTPGKVVNHGSFTDVSCTFSGNGNYTCMLPGRGRKGTKYPKLRAGHYWLSVTANSNYLSMWSWSENSTITGDAAEWENPNGGWDMGCATWNAISNCTGTNAGDFAFDLQGKSR